MAANAEEIVVTLVARNQQFDEQIDRSKTKFTAAVGDIGKSATAAEQVLDNLKRKMATALDAGDTSKANALNAQIAKLEGALGQVAATSGRSRMGMQQLGFQMNDVVTQMAMGTKASTIFAQQSGQVIQALQMMGGEGSAFLKFLAGPWGIGLSVAAIALTPLIGKLFDGGDAVSKLVDQLKEHYEKTQQSGRAQDAFAHTIEGSIAKVDELTKSLGEQNRTLEDNIELTKRATLAALSNVATNINAVSGQLAAAVTAYQAAKDELAQAESGAFAGSSTEAAGQVLTAQANLKAAEERVRTLSGQLNALSNSANKASGALKSVGYDLVERNAKEAVDPVARINRQYDDMAKKARAAGKYTQELADSIERMRKADLKAAQDQSANNRQSGRQIDFSQAESIARAAGLQVNSGYRSTAAQAALYNNPAVNRPGNPVAPPGSSAHNGANGKWAIDIQITDGVTPGSIRKIFADQGVSLTKVLKEKGHFHIEGSRSEAAAAEKEQERAAQQALQEQNRFEETRSKLNDTLLGAQSALVRGVEAQAAAAEQQVRADEARLEEAIDNDVQEGKLKDAHAEELKAIARRITVVKLTAIEAEKRLRLEQSKFDLESQERQFKIDDLRFADEAARSQAEHREIQLQILDAMYEQKRLELEHQKQLAERNGATADEIKAIQEKIDRLPTEKAHDRRQVDEQTAGPLESWLKSVPQDAQAATEALQKIEVDGLNHLSDALTNVIMGTESLGKAFGDVARQIIADIVKMILRMLIMKAVMSLFGLPGGFASGGLVRGASPIFTPENPGVPAATGGLIVGPGTGTSDSIPAMLSNGEFVLRKKVVDQIGVPLLQALNDHGPARGFSSGGPVRSVSPSNDRVITAGTQGDNVAHVILELNDPLLQVKIAKGSAAVIQGSAPGIASAGAALSRGNLARKQLHYLG